MIDADPGVPRKHKPGFVPEARQGTGRGRGRGQGQGAAFAREAMEDVLKTLESPGS